MKHTTLRSIVLAAALATVCGCASRDDFSHAYQEDIPRTAVAAAETAQRIFFQANDDGVVYLYDVDALALLLATPIKKGERFVLDPKTYRATVENRVVSETPFERKHIRRVYFDPFGKAPKPATKPA